MKNYPKINHNKQYNILKILLIILFYSLMSNLWSSFWLFDSNTIPPTNKGFKTVISGNLTPRLRKGFVLRSNRNYRGQVKQQAIVVEKPNSAPVNSQDINVNIQASKFLQEKQNHNDIQNNT